MNIRTGIASVGLAVATLALHAQKPPAVRPIGKIERVSVQPLASVFTVVALPDGRVFANDVVARRVVLLDSTLNNGRVVADSTGATANAYGARPGVLVKYHADTALFMDPASGSLLVLSPAGKIERVMAAPRPGGLPFAPNLGSLPGLDAHGRLVYFIPIMGPPPGQSMKPGKFTSTLPESAYVVRFDFAARTLDTLSKVKTPMGRTTTVRDDDLRLTSLEITPDLLPLIDEWTVAPDGAVAIVRGRDYHVDWLNADGRWTSTAKMAFDWQHLDDGQKTAVIDSAMAATKARRDSMDAAFAARGPAPPPGGGGDGARGGGRGGGGGGGPSGPPPTLVDGRPTLGDLPDYRPPFTRGALKADADGNLWIRTTILEKGQPVYDIVNRRGDVTDRVVLPPFRTIAGFGPSVVYMAVKDAAGVVHLERARVR